MKKRHSAEQVVTKLRQADVALLSFPLLPAVNGHGGARPDEHDYEYVNVGAPADPVDPVIPSSSVVGGTRLSALLRPDRTRRPHGTGRIGVRPAGAPAGSGCGRDARATHAVGRAAEQREI
ncbi:MAG: hypothetical protein QGH74_08970 [Candidatus Brocadiia bacterium]|nr:hypothetical protein [Candidatus Brocadiia bacterium]